MELHLITLMAAVGCLLPSPSSPSPSCLLPLLSNSRLSPSFCYLTFAAVQGWLRHPCRNRPRELPRAANRRLLPFTSLVSLRVTLVIRPIADANQSVPFVMFSRSRSRYSPSSCGPPLHCCSWPPHGGQMPRPLGSPMMRCLCMIQTRIP